MLSRRTKWLTFDGRTKVCMYIPRSICQQFKLLLSIARIQEEVKILEDAFAENNTESALKASIRLRYWEGLEAAARDLPDH